MIPLTEGAATYKVAECLQGNIKEAKYDIDFFKGFDLVLNGLDNLEARRHVNRMCLAAETPLLESGTEGYCGQVRHAGITSPLHKSQYSSSQHDWPC